MAAEVEALRQAVAKYKHTTVPMNVRLWSSFHAKLDASVRTGGGLFCRTQTEAEDEDLRQPLNTLLKKSAPVGFSGSTDAAQAARTKQGVPMFLLYHRLVVRSTVFEVRDARKLGHGLFALRDATFDEVQLALPGKRNWKSTLEY